MQSTIIMRPDSKGRISLGALARGVSSFQASVEPDGRIILEPYAEVPAREKWIFENKDAMFAVREGLAESAAGKIRSRGSFAEFADDNID